MRGLLLWGLALGGVSALLGTVSAAAPDMIAPLFAAHRGGAALWPENSLLAFGNALALGVDYLELDVHLSRDGEVMVIHDATLERTTTGTGPDGCGSCRTVRAGTTWSISPSRRSAGVSPAALRSRGGSWRGSTICC